MGRTLLWTHDDPRLFREFCCGYGLIAVTTQTDVGA